MAELRIGGFTGLTTIDYPEHLAAVVFCQGCPWRCDYCHNPSLWSAYPAAAITWPEVLQVLARRRKLLDAVVFSGGEPTAQRGLYLAMQQVKSLGFKLGLHTAGIYPGRLAQVLPLLDWVGLDIKTTAGQYDRLTACPNSAQRAYQSLRQTIESPVAYEVRTTIQPQQWPLPALQRLAFTLVGAGVEHWVLQECTGSAPLSKTTTNAYFAEAIAQLSPLLADFRVRRR